MRKHVGLIALLLSFTGIMGAQTRPAMEDMKLRTPPPISAVLLYVPDLGFVTAKIDPSLKIEKDDSGQWVLRAVEPEILPIPATKTYKTITDVAHIALGDETEFSTARVPVSGVALYKNGVRLYGGIDFEASISGLITLRPESKAHIGDLILMEYQVVETVGL
jgi:hypothetical protein